MTLDIGANDVAFSTCLQDLLNDSQLDLSKETDNPCTSAKGAKHTLADSLAELTTGLRDDLTQIQADYPDAQILLMDYYDPVAPEVTAKQAPCTMSYGIVANNVYKTKSSIADVVSEFVLHHTEATAKARTAQNTLYADASGIVDSLNATINSVAADFSGVTVIKPATFAAHNACAAMSPGSSVPRVDLSLTYVTYEKEADGKWKTVTKADHELFGVAGGDACPMPSVNENSKKTDIYLTDNTGTHKPEYVLALTLSSNCFPHPTPLGQENLAKAFYSQATFGPPAPAEDRAAYVLTVAPLRGARRPGRRAPRMPRAARATARQTGRRPGCQPRGRNGHRRRLQPRGTRPAARHRPSRRRSRPSRRSSASP